MSNAIKRGMKGLFHSILLAGIPTVILGLAGYYVVTSHEVLGIVLFVIFVAWIGFFLEYFR